eukprot:CAMPEP_0198144870 /NCGR_PEP_ID=MMETSP1443-20131203/19087_1 /TAXON_ID=186043 /ORGANISM="Entomoneis sp., Strain CCMP2396" /LENGTH=262 /DNA_ID=CAMNT_0043808353 /DNA_START=121 /DNA_END=909 /DNA_ORIENTATION=+
MVRLRVCPFSLAVFFGSAAYVTYQTQQSRQKKSANDSEDDDTNTNNANESATNNTTSKATTPTTETRQVVFVLGGPGAGKGTQCQLLEERLGWKHLSAGDLLRAERQKGGDLGDLINARIAAGALVPSEVTCQLLLNAMNDADRNNSSSVCTKFLIDGFPRSHGNLDAWKEMTASAGNVELKFVLCLTCPEDVLTGRLLERGKTSGRVDDDLNVIRKRYQTFRQETEPIVQHYEKTNQLKNIASDQPVEQVHQQIATLFANL